MQSKILLVNPPISNRKDISSDSYFPLGLLYLAGFLKKNGIDAKIVDINNHYFRKNIDETILRDYIQNTLMKTISEYSPSMIGVGCTFSGAFTNLRIIAKGIKDAYPDISIVIGGVQPTLYAKEIIKKYNYIDYVVIGEGESSFLELIKCDTNNILPYAIDGIAFKDGKNIILNIKTEYMQDLDSLSWVNFDILDTNEYQMDTSSWFSPKNIPIGQPFPILSSRSCPHLCTFCCMRQIHGPKIRFRSAKNILNEMEHLYSNYNIRYFQFMDDNLTFNKKRILEICDGISKRNMDIQFDTPNGLSINALDKEIITALVDAGLVYCSLAIESGSEYIRNKIMKKMLKSEKIYEVISESAKHNSLFIKGFFIIGMPQETHETLDESYQMIKDLPLDKIGISYVDPYKGTELFEYCIEHNLLEHKLEDYMDVETFQGRDEYPHFKPHNVTIDDLIDFKKKCYDYMKTKRESINVPSNYPLRWK